MSVRKVVINPAPTDMNTGPESMGGTYIVPNFRNSRSSCNGSNRERDQEGKGIDARLYWIDSFDGLEPLWQVVYHEERCGSVAQRVGEACGYTSLLEDARRNRSGVRLPYLNDDECDD